jgi:hypothetical protein
MANLIKRVVVASYETTDGKQFTDKGEAAKHQANLDRTKKIADLVAAQFETSPDSMQYLDSATPTDIAQFIILNADALREILPKRAKSIVNEEPPVLDPATPGTAEETTLPYVPVLNGNVSDAALAVA